MLSKKLNALQGDMEAERTERSRLETRLASLEAVEKVKVEDEEDVVRW